MLTRVKKITPWLINRKKTFKELFIYSLQTYGTTFISLVGAIVIVRLLDKYSYGMYGVIFAVIGIMSVVFNGGIIRLASNKILTAPLSDGDKIVLFSYVKIGFIASCLLSILALPILILLQDLKTVVYIFIAYFTHQILSFLGLAFFSDIRDRKLKNYFFIETVIEYGRVLWPLIGLIITKNLFGFFMGSLFSVFFTVSLFLVFPYWRKKLYIYICLIKKSDASLHSILRHIKLGIGMALESGAATLYGSVIILTSAYIIGIQNTANLKVLLGYFSALSMLLLPVSRWVTFHLPKRLSQSREPFSELVKFTSMGIFCSIIIYGLAVVIGPWLLPFVYGPGYKDIIYIIPYAGLFFVFSSFAFGLSIVSRQYMLSWKNAIISLVNISLGLLVLFSPFGPKNLHDFALFYGLWIIPALISSYVLAYIKIPKKLDNA